MSLLLSALGIWKKLPLALIVAGVWSIPVTYYLSAGLRRPIYLMALFVFGAAHAVYKEKIRTAWFLLFPLFLCTAWMTVFTIHNIIHG
ncbi:MAG TPA: hypothetical protein DCZ69_13485 [Syntrophobacteraceae bacterium]|nr:hypothetical protein [Syntrophobacteraceae bacterium]